MTAGRRRPRSPPPPPPSLLPVAAAVRCLAPRAMPGGSSQVTGGRAPTRLPHGNRQSPPQGMGPNSPRLLLPPPAECGCFSRSVVSPNSFPANRSIYNRPKHMVGPNVVVFFKSSSPSQAPSPAPANPAAAVGCASADAVYYVLRLLDNLMGGSPPGAPPPTPTATRTKGPREQGGGDIPTIGCCRSGWK